MTYKDLLTDPLKRNSDIVSSFKSHFQSRIISSRGHEINQVIFLPLLIFDPIIY